MRGRRSRAVKRFALISLLATAATIFPQAASSQQQATNTQEQNLGQTPAPSPAADANTKSSSAPRAAGSKASGPEVFVGAPTDDRHIVNTDLITLNVTVTDTYGRFVTGLGAKAFTVLDDKVEQEISFFSDDDAPVSLGVIFDVSGSMSGDKIKKAREALERFIDTSHQGDEYFLIGFNSRAQLLLNKTRDCTTPSGDTVRIAVMIGRLCRLHDLQP